MYLVLYSIPLSLCLLPEAYLCFYLERNKVYSILPLPSGILHGIFKYLPNLNPFRIGYFGVAVFTAFLITPKSQIFYIKRNLVILLSNFHSIQVSPEAHFCST
jgi:hypothetical protein